MSKRLKKAAKRVRLIGTVVNLLKPLNDNLKEKPQRTKESSGDVFRNAIPKGRAHAGAASAFCLHSHDDFQRVLSKEKQKEGTESIKNNDIEEKDRLKEQELPDKTDKEITDFTSKDLAGRLVESRYFRNTILFFIIMNCVLVVMETKKSKDQSYNIAFHVIDDSMMTIFICEILLKWFHGFWKFWKQPWDVLDFFLVLALLVKPVFTSEASSSLEFIRIFRVLRAFRSLRSITSLPGLQVIVQTILQSVPDMANIIVLLVIIMVVFSVIGITFFQDITPDHFGTLSAAMFSLFTCLTGDGWMGIFRAFQEKGTLYYVGGGIFLLVFISVGTFIFTNLVVAVVVTNMESAVLDVKIEEEELARERELRGLLDDVPNSGDGQEYNVVQGDDIPANVFRSQEPLFTPDLQEFSCEAVEKYFVIVTAMENNLVEYQKLSSEIHKLFAEVYELNHYAGSEGMVHLNADDEGPSAACTTGAPHSGGTAPFLLAADSVSDSDYARQSVGSITQSLQHERRFGGELTAGRIYRHSQL